MTLALAEQAFELAGLRTIAVGDADAAKAVVVLLHGFQMSPGDLTPFAHSLSAPAWFLFPEGPLSAEPQGRAWWHIDARLREKALAAGPRDFAGQNPPDLPHARQRLSAFLEAARVRAGARPLVVGGFSQGGMLVCDTLLRGTLPVSAMALFSSSRIAFDEWSPRLTADRFRGLPALVSHGERDADLAFAAGEQLRDCLIQSGAAVDWVPFPEGHEIPLVVWRRFRKLLLSLTPPKG